MNNSFLRLLIFAILTIWLYGCSRPEPVVKVNIYKDKPATDAFGNTYSGKKMTVSGKAIDGYLQDALVCIDMNDNGRCDSTDPQATTDSAGSYSIDVPAAVADIRPNLLAYVLANSTTDSDYLNQPIEKGYAISAPWGSKHITPLTSMVVEIMKTKESKAAAEDWVKQRLEIDFIDKDYIAMKSASAEDAKKAEDAHKKAKILAHIIASIRQHFDQHNNQTVDKEQADSAYNFYMEADSHIRTLLDNFKKELDALSASVDYAQLQKTLTEQAMAEVKDNTVLVDIAYGYREVDSAEEKTQLLKDYLSGGYEYDYQLYSSSLVGKQWKLTQLEYKDGVWQEVNESGDEGYESLVYIEAENKFKEVEFAQGVAVTFDNKGNVVISDGWPDVGRVKNKLDLAKKPLAWALRESADKTFPAYAEALVIQFIQTKDAYEIYLSDTDDKDNLNTLDALLERSKYIGGIQQNSITGHYINIADGLYGQFDVKEGQSEQSTGVVYLYESQVKTDGTGEYEDSMLENRGSWHREILPGGDTEIIRIEVPKAYIEQDHESEESFFVVQPHPENPNTNVVWYGNIHKAGSKWDITLYNQVAIEAIKERHK